LLALLIEAIIHSERERNNVQSGNTTTQLFFQTVNSYQRTEALKAAIELEVFTAIGEGNAAVPEIAKSLSGDFMRDYKVF
jgi:hypothetical protein